MDVDVKLPAMLSQQNYQDVCELAWSVATRCTRRSESAGRIAEHWMDKGGDVHQRAERFIIKESLHVAALSITVTVQREQPFALLARQLRLLAVFQYLSGQDLRSGATQQQTLEALYGSEASTLIPRWNDRRILFVGDYWRTYQAGRLFHQRYVAPIFPPLAPLR